MYYVQVGTQFRPFDPLTATPQEIICWIANLRERATREAIETNSVDQRLYDAMWHRTVVLGRCLDAAVNQAAN